MLEKLQKVSFRLRPVQPFVLWGIPLFIGLFVLGLTGVWAPGGDGFLVAVFLAALWCLMLACFITGFRAVPAPVDPSAGLFTRLKQRFRRFGYWLLAALAMLATVALALITLRLVLLQ